MKRQYVIDPPALPLFLYKRNETAWIRLIDWAKREFHARLVYCAENGYMREFKWLNENSSAMSILAELSGFRRMCAVMETCVWNEFTMRERSFIRRSFELRDLLMQ